MHAPERPMLLRPFHSLRSSGMALLCCFTGLAGATLGPNITEQQRIAEGYGRLPLFFEPNWGQTGASFAFLARCRNHTAFLQPDALTFALYFRETPTGALKSQFVTVRFQGANSDVTMQGLDLLPGKSNYLIGKDPQKWYT